MYVGYGELGKKWDPAFLSKIVGTKGILLQRARISLAIH